jgi:hypothetical protein
MPRTMKTPIAGAKPTLPIMPEALIAPTLAVRAPSVDFKGPGTPGVHGRIADGATRKRASKRISAGQRGVTRAEVSVL